MKTRSESPRVPSLLYGVFEPFKVAPIVGKGDRQIRHLQHQ